MTSDSGTAPARRVIFLNRFFFPDYSATSQILTDLAFYLSRAGEDVHVITSRQLYDDASANLPGLETIEGVTVHRVWCTRFGRHSLIGRVVDYFAFYAMLSLKLVALGRRDDVVVAKTDPPLMSCIIWVLRGVRGFATVNWLQDIFPELAISLGMRGFQGPLGPFLLWLRNISLRRASLNVAISHAMAGRLKDQGVPPEKIAVAPNWSDDDVVVPIEHGQNGLRRAWGFENKFVVGYSGNLGRVHDVVTVLGAARLLRERSDIVFLFVGGGYFLYRVEAAMRADNLQNIIIKAYQPRELLAQSLSAADVHWLSLRDGLEGMIVPSKFYGIAAAGRPILVVEQQGGEFSELVTRYDCGAAVLVGDSKALAEQIELLVGNPDLCRKLGANARRMLDNEFSKAGALAHWASLIGEVRATRSRESGPPVRNKDAEFSS
jgi:glycosyltransferase involved in cell wall biosynthesis